MLRCAVNNENPATLFHQRYTSSPSAQTGLVQGRFNAVRDLALSSEKEDVELQVVSFMCPLIAAPMQLMAPR